MFNESPKNRVRRQAIINLLFQDQFREYEPKITANVSQKLMR